MKLMLLLLFDTADGCRREHHDVVVDGPADLMVFQKWEIY